MSYRFVDFYYSPFHWTASEEKGDLITIKRQINILISVHSQIQVFYIEHG